MDIFLLIDYSFYNIEQLSSFMYLLLKPVKEKFIYNLEGVW